MHIRPCSDQRLAPAEDLIASGKVKLLAIDVFDTLLGRRVPASTDVFLRLGIRLRDQNQLATNQTPDSFAAIRYQMEHAARKKQERKKGNREVTLLEIYRQVPAHIALANPEELVAAEIATEYELGFANPNIVHLAALAKKNGVPFAIISNTYFDEKTITELIRAKAPSLPDPNGIFISSAHRCGKRDGLMRKMLDTFKCHPADCLLIGDNSIADIQTAEKMGIPNIYVGYDEDEGMALLCEEHPKQWHERVANFANPGGDYGLTWLRLQTGYWPVESWTKDYRAYYKYGAQMIGPLLAGFMGWATTRLKKEKAETLFGITREGEFLNGIGAQLDPEISYKTLATSRLTAALASFTPDYPEHLEDFLTRRGHWTLGMLMEQLGFTQDQTSVIDDPNTRLETLDPSTLTQKILTSPLAKTLFERSAERRKKLLLHLKTIGALEKKKLFLLDLGYAATIQRALQRIFTIENIPVTTHGLYLVSAHVSLATQEAGGIVEGFLAQNGNPNDFASAFCRSPEIIELACMPARGTVIDYKEDGSPMFADEPTGTPYKEIGWQVSLVQRGIQDFAKQFYELAKSSPSAPDYTSTAWQTQMRNIATRVVIYPSLVEAKLVGHWLADSDMGLTSPRPIVSAGPHEAMLSSMTAAELVSLPRRNVPWLYGVAMSLSKPRAKQVASLMLRKEDKTTYMPAYYASYQMPRDEWKNPVTFIGFQNKYKEKIG